MKMDTDRPWSVQSPTKDHKDRLWHARYRTQARLGSGSFGAALLVCDAAARDEKYEHERHARNSQCPRKVMKQIFAGGMDEASTAKALAEAKILEEVCTGTTIAVAKQLQMHHPNIVGFCETFVEENFVCIVIEYCEVLQVCHARRNLQGGDLSTHIAKQRTDGSHFSTEEVLDWFVELAMALQYIHDRCVACVRSRLMR